VALQRPQAGFGLPRRKLATLSESRDRSLFVDHARVAVRGGDGGRGALSFRREKFVPLGGPDGGNGGKGGDVLLIADAQKKSLLDLTYRPHFHAPKGEPGMGSNKSGHSGKDLRVYVPAGTLVFQDGKWVADLKVHGQTYLAAKGGRGGRGNSSFKTRRTTAPQISEKGEPGENFQLDLELKLLADVGFVGCPNAGKSSLLARLTSARPKIADYPFTTLNPNLGVAQWHGASIVMADIPGLIEGAHTGRGLGHEFLRHIERTRLLLHVVDMSGFDGKDPLASIQMINDELRRHSPKLMKKPMVIVANKIDLVRDVGAGRCPPVEALKKKWKKTKIFPVSAATGEGLDALLAYVAKETARPEPAEEVESDEPFRFVIELDFEVKPEAEGVFRVAGPKVEKLAAMTNFDQSEGLRRFQNILKKMGVEKELMRQGAEPGDTVKIGSIEFYFEVDDEKPRNLPSKRPYRPFRR
jgi:GTP-binding protein